DLNRDEFPVALRTMEAPSHFAHREASPPPEVSILNGPSTARKSHREFRKCFFALEVARILDPLVCEHQPRIRYRRLRGSRLFRPIRIRVVHRAGHSNAVLAKPPDNVITPRPKAFCFAVWTCDSCV